jgi:hypothetical protein
MAVANATQSALLLQEVFAALRQASLLPRPPTHVLQAAEGCAVLAEQIGSAPFAHCA